LKDISIDINIGGKNYPLQVNEKEKELVQMAAQKINETFSLLSDKYAVKDSRDLMAMTALRVVSEVLDSKPIIENNKGEEFLSKINSSLDSLIN